MSRKNEVNEEVKLGKLRTWDEIGTEWQDAILALALHLTQLGFHSLRTMHRIDIAVALACGHTVKEGGISWMMDKLTDLIVDGNHQSATDIPIDKVREIVRGVVDGQFGTPEPTDLPF